MSRHADPRAEGHREAFLAKFGNVIDSAVPKADQRAGSAVAPPPSVPFDSPPPAADAAPPPESAPQRWHTRHAMPQQSAESPPHQRRVGEFFKTEDPHERRDRAGTDMTGMAPGDRVRSVVYDDMLLAAARRNFGGVDLRTVDDNRRQFYDTQRSLRYERQREKEREWENEMALRGERQKSRLRDRERELAREREWERLCEREREKARDREREWEREKEELRRSWIEERERQREREREKESQWEISLELEREQFREAVREWEREKEAHRLQVRQGEWEWEQERERMRKAWEKRRREEQGMEQTLLDEMDQERRLREEAWEKERLELMERYASVRHHQGIPEAIGPPAEPASSRKPSHAASRKATSPRGTSPRGSVAGSQAGSQVAASQAGSRRPSQAASRRPSHASGPAGPPPLQPHEVQEYCVQLNKNLDGIIGGEMSDMLARVHSTQIWSALQHEYGELTGGGDFKTRLAEENTAGTVAGIKSAMKERGVDFDAGPSRMPAGSAAGSQPAASQAGSQAGSRRASRAGSLAGSQA
eukprot:Hpha_TRINITY_DN16362_c0_g4::TRINITY_DN16362_c0_g4_i1::g.59471::m.59471